MLQTKRHASIAELDSRAWDALFPGDAEGAAYYRAAEDSLPRGFAVEYLAVTRDGDLVAAAPVFHTRHELYASLRGPVRRALDAIARRVPRFLRLGVTGLGSPLVDRCHVAVSATLDETGRRAALAALLAGLEEAAQARGNALMAIKDLEDEVDEVIGGALRDAGFAKIRSLPNAVLDLPYASWETFLKAHPRSYWRYLKLKEKEMHRLRIEFPDNISGLSPRLHALFEQTRQQSPGDYGEFEQLDPQYFARVQQDCGAAAQFMLCWLDDRLVSFQMYMLGEREVVAKFIGMDYAVSRDLNLYFVNINQLIRIAIARGIPRLRMGNTAYAVKAVYQARLATHWICFKHRNRVVNRLLRRLAPLIDYEKNDPELAKLRADDARRARETLRS